MSAPAASHIIAVYADESCLGNGREGDNPGGAGGLIQCYRRGIARPMQRDYWLSAPGTTNNRMALRSAIGAFGLLSAKGQRLPVYFTSDSKYLVDGMTEWMPNWVRRGFRRKAGPVENEELWRELLEAANEHEHYWRWVRGHAAHPQNEYANHLATRAARRQDGTSGAVPSEFDIWLAAERERGRMAKAADVAPEPSQFREGCTMTAAAD